MGQGKWQEAILERILQNPKLVAEIGLEDEQVAKLKNSAFEIKKRQIQLRAELELAALEQANLLTAGEVDEAAIMKAVEKTGHLRTEIGKLGMRKLLLVRTTLTDEQRERIKMMMRRRFAPGRRGGGRLGRERGLGPRGDRPEIRERMMQRRPRAKEGRRKDGGRE
jgi:Spy/CpxP family protein refolding chaperone